MASIVYVTETQWTQRNVTRKTGWQYDVVYDSGRKFQYTSKQNLPMSVLSFILSDDVEAQVRYVDHNFYGPLDSIIKYTKYMRRK